MNTATKGPEADTIRDRQILTAYARSHDVLDRYGIPRFNGSFEHSLDKRVELLARKAFITIRLPKWAKR